MECLRQNQAFADLEQRISQSPVMNSRGRTRAERLGEGRAPRNCVLQFHHSVRSGERRLLLEQRERELQRTMTTIMISNKRRCPYVEDRGRKVM